MSQEQHTQFSESSGTRFQHWYAGMEKRFLPSSVWSSDMLTFWRERILFVICSVAVFLGPAVLIPSVILAYAEGRWEVVVLDICTYGMAVAILLGSHLSLYVRAWLTYLALYLLGVGLLFMLGNTGAGYIWLFGASVMMGALVGLRPAFFALMMNYLALLVIALFIAYGQPDWVVDETNAVERWLVMSLNFILINALATLTTALMLSGLQRALSREQELGDSLRQSEERFRTAFYTSPDSINISRLADGLCVDMNDVFCRMTGYSREEVIGRTMVELNIWDDPEERRRLVQRLREDGIVNNMEARFRAKGNILKTGLISASIFDYCGVPHVLSLTRDITALKVTERQLQQARKMEAIGILAGGIAHDFNNLLQAIGGYTQLLMLEKSEADPDYPNLAAIGQAVDNAAQLVRQLLTFSRKAESKVVSLELNTEIINVRKILERTLPKMIEINLHLGRDLSPVTADPVQIEQILLNLGSNAGDAMPEGGALIIETENIMLTEDDVTTRPGLCAGEHVLLSVSDTGQGMEKTVVEHIFEPFFTTKEFGKGTGLGLASVYGIVKSYGGYIACYSERGQGTTFKIYLPATARQEIPGEKGAGHTLLRGGSETILLADDEPTIRNVASTILKRFGYQVLECSDGEEALATIAQTGGNVDLVILDLGMPGMGGYKCLQEISKIAPTVKVLIASGYSANGQVKRCLESGAAGYIGKPYHVEALLQKVRAILDAEQKVS